MELLVEVQSGSNSGDNCGKQLLSIHASLAKFESTTAFVSSRGSSRFFRFIDRTSSSPSIDGFLFGSGELHLLRWANSIISLPVPHFSTARSQPSLSPLLSLPSPCLTPPTAGAHATRAPWPAAEQPPFAAEPSSSLPMAAVGGRRRCWYCKIASGILGNCAQKLV
jgi:hypothetical protein